MEPMYSISQLFDSGKIPEKFRGAIKEVCSDPHCYFPIVSNINLTYKMCLNPSCPMHLKSQATKILKYFNIKGVAEKTCYDIIISRKLRIALDIIPCFFDEKPTVFLYEAAMLAYTPGVSGEWQTVLKGMDDRSDLSRIDMKYHEYIPAIQEACKYFNIKRIHTKMSQCIVVHGELQSYGSRNSFISYCNSIPGILVTTILKTTVTNDTDFLVTDFPNDISCRKVADAHKKNKHIITPQEYVTGIITLSKIMSGEIEVI